MRVLFDSHALVWFFLGDPRLPVGLRKILAEPETEFAISAVCVWEIATKVRRGRWPEANEIIATLDTALTESAYIPLAITIEHARIAGLLSGDHRDPFDRMLAAQSQVERLPLVTADPAFRHFGTTVMWS
jgi:PIN domain nuclease of toxin-antitoxin system